MSIKILPFYKRNSFQAVRKHSVIQGDNYVALNSYGTVVALVRTDLPQVKATLHSSWDQTSTTKKNVVSFLQGYSKFIWNDAAVYDRIKQGVFTVSSDPLIAG